MAINLSNLGGRTKGKKINPREIFMALLYRNKKYEYNSYINDMYRTFSEQSGNVLFML